MNRKTGIMLFVLLSCLILIIPLTAAAAQKGASGPPQEPRGDLLVILSTDDLPSADAALRIAGVAAQRGHKVTILLRVKGIQLALKDTEYKIGQTRFQDKLAEFIKSGSRVLVGGGCMKMDGIPKQRLISGVTVGTPDLVMGLIFGENTRIICQ